MTNIQKLEKRIKALEERNKKVETDKSWETSLVRRSLIFIFTYLSVGLYLKALEITNPWLNAIIPAVGFMLSTLTLPFFRKYWEKYIHKP